MIHCKDESLEVRAAFALKLHAGLLTRVLPLHLFSLFTLAANDENVDQMKVVEKMLIEVVTAQRAHIKTLSGDLQKNCCYLLFSFLVLVLVIFPRTC